MVSVSLPNVGKADKDPLANYYFTTNINISNMQKAKYISEDDIASNSIGQLNNNEYGIWTKSDIKYQYDLYVCQTPYFYQGFLSICEQFQVNFQDYIYGQAYDKYGVIYSLNNYVFPYDTSAIDVPDLNDIEEEEEGDENVIKPLHRTDDIIEI